MLYQASLPKAPQPSPPLLRREGDLRNCAHSPRPPHHADRAGPLARPTPPPAHRRRAPMPPGARHHRRTSGSAALASAKARSIARLHRVCSVPNDASTASTSAASGSSANAALPTRAARLRRHGGCQSARRRLIAHQRVRQRPGAGNRFEARGVGLPHSAAEAGWCSNSPPRAPAQRQVAVAQLGFDLDRVTLPAACALTQRRPQQQGVRKRRQARAGRQALLRRDAGIQQPAQPRGRSAVRWPAGPSSSRKRDMWMPRAPASRRYPPRHRSRP